MPHIHNPEASTLDLATSAKQGENPSGHGTMRHGSNSAGESGENEPGGQAGDRNDRDRMAQIDRALREAEARRKAQIGDPSQTQAAAAGYSAAWRIAIELVAAILVLGGLGWGADVWLDTTPWGLLLGVLFGSVLGFYMAARSAAAMSRRAATQDGDGQSAD